MRTRVQAIALSPDAADFGEELRQIYAELDRSTASGSLTGECSPPLDLYETDEAVEVVVDLPGVDASAVRVLAKGSLVLIAGEKTPRRGRGDSSFHLVERGYGRFARVARLTSACDSSRARAIIAHGELRVSLPKLPDRRGRLIPIAIAGEPPSA